jgi:Putative nuclear envelope organisation protein
MHNIISPDTLLENRDYLVKQMKDYYYETNQSVWSTWSDSDMRQWLISNNVIKSDAQVTREKMVKMVEYVSSSLYCHSGHLSFAQG